jgi:hypothetical protein
MRPHPRVRTSASPLMLLNLLERADAALPGSHVLGRRIVHDALRRLAIVKRTQDEVPHADARTRGCRGPALTGS